MSTVEKFLTGLVAIALVTTAVLPKRQTPQVIDAIRKLITGGIGTAMGNVKVAS